MLELHMPVGVWRFQPSRPHQTGSPGRPNLKCPNGYLLSGAPILCGVGIIGWRHFSMDLNGADHSHGLFGRRKGSLRLNDSVEAERELVR